MTRTPGCTSTCGSSAQVLLAVAENPDTRLRDVAERVGITERAAQGGIEISSLLDLVQPSDPRKVRK